MIFEDRIRAQDDIGRRVRIIRNAERSADEAAKTCLDIIVGDTLEEVIHQGVMWAKAIAARKMKETAAAVIQNAVDAPNSETNCEKMVQTPGSIRRSSGVLFT